MIRKKLFLDFDGVIANTIEGIISLYNVLHQIILTAILISSDFLTG